MKTKRNRARASTAKLTSRPNMRAPKSPTLGPPRDFRGYGANPPHAAWPGGARIAVNLNLNVEAGGEHCLLEGDAASEQMLTDIGFPSYQTPAARWSSPLSSMARGSVAGGSCAFFVASISRSAFSAWYAAYSNIPN